MNNNPAPVDLSRLSIEHLMPQTPTDEWLEELEIDEETYLTNLHRLGNLTLAARPDNSKMSNQIWEYKNEILASTAHLKLNMDLLKIKKWTVSDIDKRTEEMINMICEAYPYPSVKRQLKSKIDVINEQEAYALAVEKLFPYGGVVEIKKNSLYETDDKTNGYVLASSKAYKQGNREKYWFGYRQYRFDSIKECEQLHYVLICRGEAVSVLSFDRTYLDSLLDRVNYSVDDEGNIRHYHIVLFKDKDRVSLLLSKPSIEEVDVTGYVF